MKMSKKLSRSNFDAVAERMVDKYPRSLKDVFGHKTLGNGYQSIRTKLKDQYYNKTRGTRPSTSKKGPPTEGLDSLARHDSYGCVNYCPELKDDESETAMDAYRLWLIAEHEKRDWDEESVTSRMLSTYYLQRKYILTEDKSVNDLKEEWPFLFEYKHLLDHFFHLMQVNIRVVLPEILARKGPTIMGFMGRIKKTNSTVQHIKEATAIVRSAVGVILHLQ